MYPNSAHSPYEGSSALISLFSSAERDYVRYFDLFTSKHYLKHKDKRKLAAQRFSVLNKCNELIQSQTYTKKEIFEAYKSFKTSSITHYNSFLRKLKEFHQLGAVSCTHGRIGQSYEYKMNPFTNALVMGYLCDPHYYSASQIAEYVNKNIERHNANNGTYFSTISQSLVYHYSNLNRTEINYFREGKRRFDTATRPYLPRITALNPGSLEQMDGTPIQIFCWNSYEKQKTEGKRLIRLNLFVLRDAYSGKITGFDLSESEDRFNIINALKMRVHLHGHLPAELVHDNSSATKTDEFKSIKQHLENKGVLVRAAKVGNAQDKGEVERFFGTFQSRFQRLIDGYLGEGIRSKRRNGRISEEFLAKHQKTNGHYEYDEMMKIIGELILMYNNTEISKYGNKTPNQLYKEGAKPYIKKVDDLDMIQMFWLNKEVQVKRSMIMNIVRKLPRHYEVWSDEDKLKINGKKVRIYYDEKDAREIYVFTLDGDFVCTCKEKKAIHEAAVDRMEGEEKTIYKHVAHCDTFGKHIEKKAVNRVKEAEKYINNDFEMINVLTMEKGKLHTAENKTMIDYFLQENGISTKMIRERKPTDTGTPYNGNKYLTNNNKQSREGAYSSRKRFAKA